MQVEAQKMREYVAYRSLRKTNSTRPKLSMDIHSGHFGFTVSLNHTQKFPAISFIETSMVCNQVDRCDSLCPQIIDNHIQQAPRNSLAAVFFFCVYSAYIG